jgi:DNA-binding LacI/PurR family transcriptional regulator
MLPVRRICEEYGVSNRTAARAVQALTENGTLNSIPRKGTFVNSVPEVPEVGELQQLENIIVVYPVSVHYSRPHSFHNDIVEEIFRQSSKDGLTFRTETSTSTAVKKISLLPFVPGPTDGVIVISGKPSLDMFALLDSDNFRSVLVDAISPYTSSVLTDNYSGMRQILEHLKGLGHQRIALAWGEVIKPNIFNENERKEAFLNVCRSLDLDCEILEAARSAHFIPHLKKIEASTAIVFTKDTPAIEFVKAAQEKGLDVPGDISVVGFDNFASDLESLGQLTTVGVDKRGIGKAAYELIKNMKREQYIWQRIPCKLIVRKTTAPVKGGK